jgi:ribosomal protein S12 methylthiotransferase
MRGKHKSTPIEQLVKETKGLAKNGVKELILIAQDLTFYGLDIYEKRRLADLLTELSKVEGIEWIRLHYAFPTGFPQDVLDVIRDNGKVCNYIDIPLQHINDEILKSMKRGTSFEKTNDLIKDFRMKVPNIAIRTSLIVGYPGETEEKFQELKQWVQDTKFDRLGVFTYSHEENTSAFDLVDDVPDEIKKARAEEIMDLQTHISWELNQEKVGKTFKVLFDRKEGDYFIGRTEFDSPDVDNEVLVKATDSYIRMGDFAKIKINKTDHFDLYGDVAE